MIYFQNVSKIYPGSNSAINNLCFDISDGETLGIIGPIGAGKTTLLRMLAGLIKPTDGNLHSDINKKSIGYMPATEGLIHNLSVLENLRIWASAYNASEDDMNELIEFFRMSSFINKKIFQLSSGLWIITAFACAVIGNSKLILLDEPFVHLDVESALNVEKYIKCKLKNRTVLLSSHNLEYIEGICDKYIILDHGIQKYFGTADQLKKEYSSKLAKIKYNGILSRKDKKYLEDNLGFNFIDNGIVYVDLNIKELSSYIEILRKYNLSIEGINEQCTGLQEIYLKILEKTSNNIK